MILRQRAAALLFCLYSSLLILLSAAQKPSHSLTSFDNLPARLVFFDDTESVIYFDSVLGNVHVSQDEGKTWSLADGIPRQEALMFIEHPFNRNSAFVLTEGKRHYRTNDRGKTWRPFEMPVKPSLISKPLSFHAKDPDYILYQGTVCERSGWSIMCYDETYYTKEAFGDDPRLLFKDSSRCQFAHSSLAFKHEAHNDLIYCVGFDGGDHSLSSSKLFSSTDFFMTEKKTEDLGIGRDARGVFAFTIVAKFAVVALKDVSPHSNGELHLYVTVDTKSWAKAQFPHASSAQLKENAYTIVESTTHSLGVDVVLGDLGAVGTLFVSNSNGTYFVESLKDTNRNEMGYVDYEPIYGVEGVGLANVVSNPEAVEGRHSSKQLKSLITYDEGRHWSSLRAPSADVDGKRFPCNTADAEDCSLHLYSVTSPHNFGRIFSSPAPGLIMGVGSVGEGLAPYESCDLFLSTDAGINWKMVRKDAHMYEFGDSGSILVAINDEEVTDELSYSLNLGKTWDTYKLPVRVRAKALVTLPDSTSQKFLLSAQVPRQDQSNDIGRYVIIYLDFADTRTRKCEESDFEKWYARAGNSDSECLMGHKQWYKRRKPDANCYVGQKFNDPEEHEDNCDCTDLDFECDFNYVRNNGKCEPVGPEPIPAGVCTGTPDQKYMGSSGWRKIPGNTCEGGKEKDKKVEKDCSKAQPPEGQVVHQIFEFPSTVVQQAYFRDSKTILVRLDDGSIWQSSNEGYTWNQIQPDERFVAFYHHPYSNDRAYLLTSNNYIYTTTDFGRLWTKIPTPNPPNTFRAQVLRFQPKSDHLIWIGNENCDGGSLSECHAKASYSRDNGKNWTPIESYVVNCAWAADTKLEADPTEILCESYSIKRGSQNMLSSENKLELIEGKEYYKKKKKLFDEVVGFAKFSEFLVVAEMLPSRQFLDLQVSLDGVNFAAGMFPPGMKPDSHAYTVLESSTNSLFLHKTMSEAPFPFWGNILKSNSNGTYFILSAENVNRDDRGYVDFEKVIGLDGIALINVVANPLEATLTGKKALKTKITHNDGSTWKNLSPPQSDSLGNPYPCDTTNCNLHIHGYTERIDPRATYSSPSVPGLIMAVGNVGEELISYTASDTFLSRDGGFSWEEVHKDAHLWEFGDSGSLLVMANDEEPTDHILFSTDQGSTWREYTFSTEKVRVRVIVTVPSDTSRRFILFGEYPGHRSRAVAVHIDFSALVNRQCVLDLDHPANDDFELWSPSEERNERCLFGRQTLYHRRIRDAQCYVGEVRKIETEVKNNCTCTDVDFECEFNYVRNEGGECVLYEGLQPLDNDPDAQCATGEDYWYERTAYRKIPYSSCEGGDRKDRGKSHPCPGFGGHSALFWWFIILIPFAFTGLVALWYYRRSGLARGNIRLPTDGRSMYHSDSGIMATLASVPWFLIGVGGIAYEWVVSQFENMSGSYRARRGYRNVPVDEDAQILRFHDEEQN
ncbi:vacuolar protein sorting/targeting protein 10 [Dendrothele bispora CBS 962.96]|uniref:Vacuolar protein sorting/targeting protein 10 n=1 Tax=Dendrothele bispora (strain CBS 962.96) TaxID=1314807 RepID=A0A4S8LWT4_DENBC|nr:vacuolar protein sorting/targeting protein 10 [Dendrothele bispora CBS 962.96]